MLCVWKKEHDNQTLEKTLTHPYRICTGVVIAECSVFYDHGPGAQLIRKGCPGRQELLTIKKTMFVVYLLHQQNILYSRYLLRKSPISPMVKAVGLASWFRKVLNSSALSCKAWGSETSMATQGMTLRRSLNRSSTTFVSIWKEKS